MDLNYVFNLEKNEKITGIDAFNLIIDDLIKKLDNYDDRAICKININNNWRDQLYKITNDKIENKYVHFGPRRKNRGNIKKI
jgi:hypothetical protein